MQKFTFLLIFGFLSFLSCTDEEKKDFPNIILIMADDMGYETLGCYGGLSYKTPTLDALAESGVRFENCISQPLCTPSRVKIMTGRYNYHNYTHFGRLVEGSYTFGNLLKETGYATCIAGKWQLNGLVYPEVFNDWNDASRPHKFGFDEYCLWQLTKPPKLGGRFADPLIEQNGKVLPRDKELYGPDIFCDFILDFIDRKKAQPFFVYYPMVLVHDPFDPTPDSEEWNNETERFQNDTVFFADMMTYADKIVGKIVNKLKALGLEDNTLVIFTADNGTHRRVFSKTSNGIVQGGKGNTTDAGTRVPLIVSWGANIKQPMVYDGLVEFSDFYATLAELAGVNSTSDGMSFLPVLQNRPQDYKRETVFVHYDPRWGQNVNRFRNQFVRSEEYKLYRDGSFYNVKHDVLEENDLSTEKLSPEVIKIKRELEKELSRHPELQ